MANFTIPARRDLFDRALATYAKTIDAILEYRSLAYLMQNPGVELSADQLTQNYESYVALRTVIATQFAADIVAADQVFAETLQAVQATAGQQAPAPQLPAPATLPPLPGESAASSTLWDTPDPLPSPPPGLHPFGPDTPYEPPPNPPWIQALEKIATVEEILEQLPDRASDFVASVSEKLTSMRAWIEKKHFITEKMQNAIDGMEAGATRWLESGKDQGSRKRRR